MKATNIAALLLVLGVLVGCVNTQVLPAHRILVRVVDASTGAEVHGATITSWFHSRVAHVPDIVLEPVISDARGVAVIAAVERTLQIRGFDHNWAGGYDAWPTIRAAHPDYESSAGYMGHHVEAIVREKGELLYRLIRKKPNKAPEPTTTAHL